jgi:hypothetical protein
MEELLTAVLHQNQCGNDSQDGEKEVGPAFTRGVEQVHDVLPQKRGARRLKVEISTEEQSIGGARRLHAKFGMRASGLETGIIVCMPNLGSSGNFGIVVPLSAREWTLTPLT